MATRVSGAHDTPFERALAERILPLRAFGEERVESVELDLCLPESPLQNAAVSAAVIEALETGETHYTARTGIDSLRTEIATRSTEEGFPASPATTVVTNGGSEAMYIALQTLITPGRRVLLLEPCPPSIDLLVEFIGGIVQRVPSADDLQPAGDPLIVLAPASGFDGRRMPDSVVADILKQASGTATVLLDRSSIPDCYEEQPPFAAPELTADAVTIGSFSGAYGLAGWRVGYFSAPEHMQTRLAGLKESMSISTTTPSQFAALAALRQADDILDEARRQFATRRGLVTGLLDQLGIVYARPEVYPGLLLDMRSTGQSDIEVAQWFESEASVRVEPASRYGSHLAGWVRIDLRAPRDVLTEGIRRIATLSGKGAQ